MDPSHPFSFTSLPNPNPPAHSTPTPTPTPHPQTVRLYDAGQNAAKGIWRNHAAVLDCAVQDDQTGYSGGLDRAVRMYVRA